MIVTSNGWPALLPLGLGIVGPAVFFLFPPVLVEQRRRARGQPPLTGTLLRTKVMLAGIVASLALYPILTIAVDSVTTAVLERHGYRSTVVDPGHRSTIHEVRWTRPGAR